MNILRSYMSARAALITAMIAVATVFGGMLFALPTEAIELSDTVQLHGFASQAYLKTDHNRFFGKSDRGSYDFREFGANLSWKALPNLQFSAQGTSRKAGDTADASPRLDYGLVDFTFLNATAVSAGLRAGRHKNPFGLYNQTRDVANARPSILLPESIYSDSSRDILLSLDGAQIYGEYRSDIGDFFLDFGGGYPILDKDSRQTFKPAISYVGRLLYERNGGQFRFAITGAEANGDVTVPGVSGKLNFKIYIFSAQVNGERWSLTGEYEPVMKANVHNLQIDLSNIGPTTLQQLGDTSSASNDGKSYYLQATYRLARHWEVLLRYDVQFGDKNDKTNPDLFAKDWTTGLGWNFYQGFLVRAEWHSVDGMGWLPSQGNPDPVQHWNLYAVQVSYAF